MEEKEHEVKPVDPRRFGDMYDMVVREDGYQGSYEQFTQELMDGLNRLGCWEDKRTPAERRLGALKSRIGSAHERGYHNSAHPDKDKQKKKKKRRKAVLKQHRR